MRLSTKFAIAWLMSLVLANCAYTIPADQLSELGLYYSLTRPGSTAAVSNLRTGGYVHTGFMFGTAAPSPATNSPITAVEVSFDGGAWSTATGTTNWSIALPAGANGWRQDSQHTIQVRGLDGNGDYSDITTLTVRKGINRDVNGDGYQDIVLSAETHNSNQGRAYIFYGGAPGLVSKAATAADTIISGEAGGQRFSTNVALADFTGDGYADLIVTARFAATNAGRAYIFHSAGSSGIASRDLSGAGSADTVITGSGGGQFGQGLAVGDINGDGFADALISQPNGSSLAGNVYAFHSQGTSGITATTPAGASSDISTAVNGLFGNSLALGDVNGDGFADALIGEPQQVGDTIGRAYVFLSTGTSGLPTTTSASAAAVITGESAGNNLGQSALLADMNGDGYSDAVLDARAYSSNLGRVYYFPSAGSGGISSAGAASAATILTGPTEASSAPQFGRTLSAGDVNGDGFLDLGVTALFLDGSQPDAGGSFVFLSSGAGGLTSANVSSPHATFAGSMNTSVAGTAIALRDMNGDGYADALMTGGFSTGLVYYFQSAGANGLTSQDLAAGGSTTATLTGEGTGDNFGFAMER